MTKITETLSLEPLETHLKHLLDALGRDDDDIDYTRIDKITRALLVSLKTFEQMRLHQAHEAALKANAHYTKFEDLKRPPEHERTRMVETLNRHFKVIDGGRS